MAIAKSTITYLDYGREKSTVTMRATANTAANFDAQEVLFQAVVTAIAAVTLGTKIKTESGGNVVLFAETPPAAQEAQRESKWLVQFEDDVTYRAGTLEIPCVDFDELEVNKETLDITAGAGLALKNALEAYHLSVEENAITVQAVTFVARRT